MCATYSSSWYGHQGTAGAAGAAHLLPLIIEHVRPLSVVDVGCATGEWLAAALRCGVSEVMGIDSPAVPLDKLVIGADRFLPVDLADPPEVGRSFDLALCLEVAEHLPERVAGRFVGFLAQLSPVVAFSAAIPHQGGRNHVNEQWQDYWRRLFAEHGMQPFDFVRRLARDQTSVPAYYLQNLIVYVDAERAPKVAARLAPYHVSDDITLDYVHPRVFLEKADPAAGSLGAVVRALPPATMATVRRRLRRIRAGAGS